MQMPPDDMIPPHFEIHEGEDGEPLAIFVAKPPGAEQFALAFGLHDFRHFLAQAHDTLLQMRAALADYFLAESPTTGQVEHLVAAAALYADHEKGRKRPTAALCGARPAGRTGWEMEPLDNGQLPCVDCTCPACLQHYDVQSIPQGHRR